MPGEEAVIKLNLKNESAGPVIITQFPPKVSIVLPGTGMALPGDVRVIRPGTDMVLPGLDGVVVHTFPAGIGQKELAAGENVTCSLTWDQKDNTGKQVAPGWYFVENELKLKNTAEPPMEWGTGGRERLLLVQYPQGAMEKVIEMEQSQTVAGQSFRINDQVFPVDIILTLKRVELSQERSSFFLLLTVPNNTIPGGYAGPPLRTIRLDAQYIVDGVVKQTWAGNRQATASDVEIRYGYNRSYLDPVPSDAKSLSFVITCIGDQVGRWEFTVPLAP